MPISLAAFNEYVNQLSNHDWFFQFSDDHRIYSDGNERHEMLLDKANSDQIYQDLFSAFNVFGTSTGELSGGRVVNRDREVERLRAQVIASQETEHV